MAITKITTPELFDFSATNTALQLPTGTTAQRPGTLAGTANPVAGEWRYNTTLKYVEFYDGANWFRIDTEAIPAPSPVGNENFNVNTYFGNGGTQTLDAKFNEAANFNGSSSVIDLPSLGLDPSDSLSFSLWIKGNTVVGDNTMFSLWGDLNIDLRVDNIAPNANTINIVIYSGGFAAYDTTFTMSVGTWAHLVITYVNGTGFRVYKDGGAAVVISFTGTIGTQAGTNKIGASGAGSGFFSGSIDQVRVFNAAITDAEAEDLYTDETTTTAATLDFPVGAGCIAAYQLDGNGNDISTNYNSTSTTDIGYTGLKFSADLAWIKQTSSPERDHLLFDTVRGPATNLSILYSNLPNAQDSGASTFLSSISNNALNLGNSNYVNGSSLDYVAWNWKAGGTPDAINGNNPETPPTLGSVMIDGVKSTANLNGSIAAKKISANTDAGFSIVEHLGSGANATVAHGLSSILELIIYKQYNDVGSGKNWVVYAKPLGDTKNIIMNLTSTGGTDPDSWNDTSPTDTVFSLGPGSNSYGSQTNVSGKLNIAYCFHSVPGYSKIGSYLWSATSYTAGVMVNDLGFTPRFVMIKGTTVISNWYIFDNTRGATGAYVYQYPLFPDDAAAQDTTGFQCIQFNSNGFSAMVWRASPLPNTTGSSGLNEENQTYLYFAVA